MEHYVGEEVMWETIGGIKYEGQIIEIDSNVLIVELIDGRVVSVEGWKFND